MGAVIFLLMQVVVVMGLSLIERRNNAMATDWLRNIQAWLIDVGIGWLMLPLLQLQPGAALLDGSDLPFVVGFAIVLVLRDGAEFLYHFCQHKIPFLWRMHSLHHSDPEMTALTTNRHFWGDSLIKSLTIWPLTAIIISPTVWMIYTYSFVALYNYFVHANLNINFGRWSWVINSPAYHRRHHSRLREHYDSNFAAIFPIFDVICGTYRRPDGWPPTGQETAPASWSEILAWPFIKAKHPEEAAKPVTC